MGNKKVDETLWQYGSLTSMESIFALGFRLEASILGLLEICSWARSRCVSPLAFLLNGKI